MIAPLPGVPETPPRSTAGFLDQFRTEASSLGVVPLDHPSILARETPISELRRSRRGLEDDTVQLITLTELDGVLRVEIGAGLSPMPGRRSRYGGTRRLEGRILEQSKFETLPPSEITAYLMKLDEKLTPKQGLRRWDGAALQPVALPGSAGRILLFIHGTFSSNDNLFGELQASRPGQDFLARASAHYGQILTFDHPTLSVSPMINALDLARLFQGIQAPVDVICHSRGGLVTRWWREVFDRVPDRGGRTVFVGCPLAGTDLAAPPRLRNFLNLLTNLARAFTITGEALSSVVPFSAVVAGLTRVIGSVLAASSKTPLVDAAVAMIPGISSMSRVGNNNELLRLQSGASAPLDRYFAIRSNFEPPPLPIWEFWRRFTEIKDRSKNFVTDLVFSGENDLVVNTPSMTTLGDALKLPPPQIHAFPTGSTVHHTNYFRQPETIRFLGSRLKVPGVQ